MNSLVAHRAALARRFAPAQWMRVSLAVALAVLALKVLAWALTGSVGLLSDALESLVNVAAALFGVLMLRLAAQPADAGHPFGHVKAEYFSAAFEGVLITLAAAAIFWTAVPRLLHPRPLPPLGAALALSLASSLLNAGLAWLLLGAARTHRSLALEADAQHLLADVWTSVGVAVGLVAAWAEGWLWMDALVALAVAANVLREGARLLWRAVQGLMDAAAEPQTLAALHAALARFAGSEVRFDHVATRRAGQRDEVSLHMHLPAHWSLARAAALRGEVERALLAAVPHASCAIQMLPVDAEPLAVLAVLGEEDRGERCKS